MPAALRTWPGRRWVGLFGVTLVVLGLASHDGTALIIALVLCMAAALSRLAPWDVALVAGAGAGVLMAVVVGLAAWVTGCAVFSSTGLSLASLASVTLAAAWAGIRPARPRPHASHPGQSRPAGSSRWWWVAQVPSMAAVAGGVAHLVSFEVTARWVGVLMDPAEHAWLVLNLQRAGSLDYTQKAYPRGLHALAAWAYTAAGQPQDLADQLQAGAALSWLCLAVFVATATSVAVRLTHPSRSERYRALVGLAVGVNFLALNSFIIQFVLAGAHASLLALSVSLLPVLLSQAFPGRPRRWMLAVLPVLTALQLHLWSAAALAPAAVSLLWVARVLQGSGGDRAGSAEALVTRLRWRTTWRTLLPAAVVSVPALALVLPVLFSLLGGGGLGLAASPGRPMLPPSLTLAMVVCGVLGLVFALRHPGRGELLTVVAGYVAMTAALTAGSGKVDLNQWYPAKGLWFAVASALPAAAPAIVAGVGVLGRRVAALTGRWLGGYARLANFLVAALTVTGLLLANSVPIWLYLMQRPAIGVPFQPFPEYLPPPPPPPGYVKIPAYEIAQISHRRVDIALGFSNYDGATTLPVEVGFSPAFDGSASLVTSMLMRLTTDQQETAGRLKSVCADLSAVADGREVIVVTALPVERVEAAMRDQGCQAPVEELPWPATEPGESIADTLGP